MIARIKRLLNIKPGEGRPVALLTGYYFFITAISITGRSVSNALFFSRVDHAESIFPLMLIPVTIVAALTVAIYARLARRVALVPLLTLTGLFFAALLTVLIPLLTNSWALILLYIVMEVLNIVMFFQFYIFAGTIFDTRQAKRIFGILGLGGALATIISGLALKPFTAVFGSIAVLVMAIGFVLLSIISTWIASRYMRQPVTQTKTEETVTAQKTGLDNYLRTIIIVLASTILVATVVDYQYKVLANRYFNYDEITLNAYYGLAQTAPPHAVFFNNDEVDMTAFFGSISALVGALQLVMRLFLVGPILTTLGILAGLILLPIAIGINTVVVLVFPVVLTGAMLKVFDQAIRFTLNETTMELLWVPVSPSRKLAYKPFVNGTIPSIMQGVAGVLIFIVVTLFASADVQVISLIVLGVVAVWVTMIFRLRQGYIEELMSSIQQRELVLEDMDLDSTDATIINTIDRSLQSEHEVQRAFTLNLIENLSLTPWARTLNQMFYNDSYIIRHTILGLAAENREIISDDDLVQFIEGEPDELTAEAITAAGKRGLTAVLPALEQHLTRRDFPEVRAAAARSIMTMNTKAAPLAQQALSEMLESPDLQENRIALNTLTTLPSATINNAILRDMLVNRSIATRALVLKLIEQPDYLESDQGYITIIAGNLDKPVTRQAAQKVLKNYRPEVVVEALTDFYKDSTTSDAVRAGILLTLAQYPTTEAARQLLGFFETSNLELYRDISNALLSIARQKPFDRELITLTEAKTLYIARMTYAKFVLLTIVPRDETLLYDILVRDVRILLPTLLTLSILDVPETQIEMIISSLVNPDPQLIANILEILDNVLSRNERHIIVPLFEVQNTAELARTGRQHFNDLPTSADPEVQRYVSTYDTWRSLVALDYILRNWSHEKLAGLDWRKVPNNSYNSEMVSTFAAHHPEKLPASLKLDRFMIYIESQTMYSVLEKTIVLKSVPIFQHVDTRELFHIAQIAEEKQFDADTLLFAEGDTGDKVYIITAGRVRVHKGTQEVAVLGQYESLGEMSLFDELPRSASATTLEPTTVFTITHRHFREVMASQPEIMEAVIKTLSLRLRAVTQTLTQMT